MKFPPKRLRLISIRGFNGKDGKELTLLKFADTQTYENIEVFCPKDVDPARLNLQKDYDVVLDIDGRFTNYEVIESAPVKAS